MVCYGFNADGDGLLEFSKITVGGDVSGEVEDYSG
jgi:hypothetical protein